MKRQRPLLVAGLKMYFDHEQTVSWAREATAVLRARPRLASDLDLVLLPSLPSIPALAGILDGLPISLGAQDLSEHEMGAYTGEVAAESLRQIGCRYAMTGHLERRRYHGEDDSIVAAKVGRALRSGLTPILCVGEPARCAPAEAARHCIQQISAGLQNAPDEQSVVILYEPAWAVGAAEPAGPEHISAVSGLLREDLDERWPRRETAIVYGGAVGPGMVAAIWGAVDGIGSGRRIRDIKVFATILDELLSLLATE